MTAGHCRGGSEVWWTRFPDLSIHNIGAFYVSKLSSSMDAGLLHIDNLSGWAPRDLVLITDGPDTSFQDTYKIQADSYSTVGQRVCTTSAWYGRTDCGYVTQTGVSADYGGGLVVSGLVRGNFCGTEGDSGAPMYAYNVACGLQVAGYSECDSLYQPIRAAENALNVDVVFE
jgi:hypothetical protein